jgi:hypothetical protein
MNAFEPCNQLIGRGPPWEKVVGVGVSPEFLCLRVSLKPDIEIGLEEEKTKGAVLNHPSKNTKIGMKLGDLPPILLRLLSDLGVQQGGPTVDRIARALD